MGCSEAFLCRLSKPLNLQRYPQNDFAAGCPRQRELRLSKQNKNTPGGRVAIKRLVWQCEDYDTHFRNA